MRLATAALIGLTFTGLAAAAPAQAQNLNDIGRSLQGQLLGGRPNPDAERRAYEQGRQDQESARRRDDDYRRQSYDDQRRYDADRRHRFEDAQRHQQDLQRHEADQRRSLADEERARAQSRGPLLIQGRPRRGPGPASRSSSLLNV